MCTLLSKTIPSCFCCNFVNDCEDFFCEEESTFCAYFERDSIIHFLLNEKGYGGTDRTAADGMGLRVDSVMSRSSVCILLRWEM